MKWIFKVCNKRITEGSLELRKKAGKGLVTDTDRRGSGTGMCGDGETDRNGCRQPEKVKEEETVSFFRIYRQKLLPLPFLLSSIIIGLRTAD